jgi:hypothetical protein
MTDFRHLTEAERHGAAEGALAPDVEPDVSEHLGACAECATDVARIKTFMTRTREAPSPSVEEGEDLWPAIRARIEQEKVLSLGDRRAEPPGRRRAFFWSAAGIAAASAIAVAVWRSNITVPTSGDRTVGDANLVAVAESTHVYEEQARFLLNELELRRAFMRPQTAVSIDHDLQVIDGAIAELKRAIERDPRNPALRALLAQSYKQKVDLLKRIGNAG